MDQELSPSPIIFTICYFQTVFISARHFSLHFLFKQGPIRFRATMDFSQQRWSWFPNPRRYYNPLPTRWSIYMPPLWHTTFRHYLWRDYFKHSCLNRGAEAFRSMIQVFSHMQDGLQPISWPVIGFTLNVSGRTRLFIVWYLHFLDCFFMLGCCLTLRCIYISRFSQMPENDCASSTYLSSQPSQALE